MLSKLFNALKREQASNQHVEPGGPAPEITGVIHKVRHKGETEGLRVGVHIVNGNLVLDLSEPVQYVGLTPDEARSFGAGIMAIATQADETPKAILN